MFCSILFRFSSNSRRWRLALHTNHRKCESATNRIVSTKRESKSIWSDSDTIIYRTKKNPFVPLCWSWTRIVHGKDGVYDDNKRICECLVHYVLSFGKSVVVWCQCACRLFRISVTLARKLNLFQMHYSWCVFVAVHTSISAQSTFKLTFY